MFLRTQRLQASTTLIQAVLAALVNAAPSAIFDITAKIHLYSNGPILSKDMVVGDFTEATFTGSTAVTVASVLGPLNLPTGEGNHKEIDWLCSAAPGAPETIRGVYITDSTSATVLAAEQFDTPVIIKNAGDGISYDLILAPNMVWGGEQGA